MSAARPTDFLPVVLSVAGSDSGGGAGIQADLAAFRFFEVWGTVAVTAVTAQTPSGVTHVEPVPPSAVSAQMEAVFRAFPVAAVKTGMLGTGPVVECVSRVLREHPRTPLVVDPVMIAGSGRALLDAPGRRMLTEHLLPRADVLTPNLPEAAFLLGRRLRTPDELAAAALELAGRYRAWVLLKGGHSPEPASDWLTDGEQVWRLKAPVQREVPGLAGHGTGCGLSAAWAACLALGKSQLAAAAAAKAYVLATLRRLRSAGGRFPVRWTPDRLPLEEVSREPWPG